MRDVCDKVKDVRQGCKSLCRNSDFWVFLGVISCLVSFVVYCAQAANEELKAGLKLLGKVTHPNPKPQTPNPKPSNQNTQSLIADLEP